MDIKTLLEELRTSILCENVSSYIEKTEEVNNLLQQVGLGEAETAKKVDMQDSEDFYITEAEACGDSIAVGFQMPFIMCINEKYNIQSVAVGKLCIPCIERYPYQNYNFSSMNRTALLKFADIIKMSAIRYIDCEILGDWN